MTRMRSRIGGNISAKSWLAPPFSQGYAHRWKDTDGDREAWRNIRDSILNLRRVKEKFQSNNGSFTYMRCLYREFRIASRKKNFFLVHAKANDLKGIAIYQLSRWQRNSGSQMTTISVHPRMYPLIRHLKILTNYWSQRMTFSICTDTHSKNSWAYLGVRYIITSCKRSHRSQKHAQKKSAFLYTA